MNLLSIIYIAMFFISIYLIYKIIKILNIKIYHFKNPGMPHLKTNLLKSELTNKYGKKQGKKLYNEICFEIWDKLKIK